MINKIIRNKKYQFILFGIMIGMVISIPIIGAAATMIDSSIVSYSNSRTTTKNVKASVDQLYDIALRGNATADNLSQGKTALVNGKLITGTGKDITTSYNSGIEAGKKECQTIVHNSFSGQYIAIDGFVGGDWTSSVYTYQTYLDYIIDPTIFEKLTYTAYGGAGSATGRYQGCGGYGTAYVKLIDTVTGAEVANPWPSTQKNKLKIFVYASASGGWDDCVGCAYVTNFKLLVR